MIGNSPTSPMGTFDVVIRTQAEFESLLASPTWFDAVSICFVGDGGTLKFAKSDGNRIMIPQTVKQIQGMTNAIIDVIDFTGQTSNTISTTSAAISYQTQPITCDYFIHELTVNCQGINQCIAFSNCRQLINCIGASIIRAGTIGNQIAVGFVNCSQLINCSGSGVCLATSAFRRFAYGFHTCAKLVNCIANGNATAGAGFNVCDQLTNCTGIGDDIDRSVSGYNRWYGFRNCSRLTSCTGTGTAQLEGLGFGNCTLLTNCIGTGIGISAGAESMTGYGFKSCSYLNGCKQGDTPSTTAFLGGTNTKVDTLTVVAE